MQGMGAAEAGSLEPLRQGTVMAVAGSSMPLRQQTAMATALGSFKPLRDLEKTGTAKAKGKGSKWTKKFGPQFHLRNKADDLETLLEESEESD